MLVFLSFEAEHERNEDERAAEMQTKAMKPALEKLTATLAGVQL